MKVKFLKDWQSENSASFKKNDVRDIEPEDLAWELAMQGYVKFVEGVSQKEKRARQKFIREIKGV